MNIKILIAGTLIIGSVVFGSISFVQNNVEYVDFATASASHKKVQVKGQWVQEKDEYFDPATNRFVFSLRDGHGKEMKVVFDGAKPNNFEMASSVVIKGKCENDYFHASEILTKCPSKYEAQADSMQTSG